MRITVGTSSQSLPDILGARYQTFTGDKESQFYSLTIQNLWESDIYIENGEPASIDQGYILKIWNQVEITTRYINKVYLISEGIENNNIRIITN